MVAEIKEIGAYRFVCSGSRKHENHEAVHPKNSTSNRENSGSVIHHDSDFPKVYQVDYAAFQVQVLDEQFIAMINARFSFESIEIALSFRIVKRQNSYQISFKARK